MSSKLLILDLMVFTVLSLSGMLFLCYLASSTNVEKSNAGF